MKKNINFGFLFIILGAMLWGIDGVLITPNYFKNGFYDVKYIAFIAHLFPTIILSIIFHKEFKKLKTFKKEDYIFYILIALFGGVIGTLSIVKALVLSEFSKISIVILIQKMQPIFAIILAYIILKERPKKKFYLLAVIAIILLYFLSFGFNNPVLLPKDNILAVMYSLLAAISFGSSTVFGKKVVSNNSFLTSTFYRFFFTSIILLILVLLSGNFFLNTKIFFSNSNLIKNALLIAVLGPSSAFIYYKGLTSTKAMYATICELAFPITSVIIESLYLKNYLEPVQLISGLLLLIIVVKINFVGVEK